MRIEDLNLKDFEYQTEEVLLLPLSGKHRHLFPPDLYERLHEQLVSDGTLETVFTGMPDAADINAWKGYIDQQPVVLYIIKPDRLVGFGWITQVQGIPGQRKGAFGFVFFKSAWGTQKVRDLCWLSLRWWTVEMDVQILYATSLKTNRLAVNFALKNFGFQKIGTLPMFFLQGRQLVDAVLIYLKKTDFDPLYERWRFGLQELPKPFVAKQFASETVIG